MKRLLVLLALGSTGLAGFSGCSNPDVPAGHEGYIYYKPLLFGQMEFRESLPGPATTGVSWRLNTINVDMRTRSYTEAFQLFTKENLSVGFEVNTRIRLRPGSVQDLVENWGGTDWYEWNVKEQLRTIVRVEASKFSALKIQTKTNEVKAKIEEELRLRISNTYDPATKSSSPTPFIIESVDIGEIHFPVDVKAAIEKKIATTQELKQQEFILAKVKKEAAGAILEAIGVAEEQLTIGSTLDPLYVQYRAIQVYRRIAKSDNHTTIVLPNSEEGTALPLILDPKSTRVLSATDKARIKEGLNALKVSTKASLKSTAGVIPSDMELNEPSSEIVTPTDIPVDPEASAEPSTPSEVPSADDAKAVPPTEPPAPVNATP